MLFLEQEVGKVSLKIWLGLASDVMDESKLGQVVGIPKVLRLFPFFILASKAGQTISTGVRILLRLLEKRLVDEQPSKH